MVWLSLRTHGDDGLSGHMGMAVSKDTWGWLSLRTLGDDCREETHGDGSLQGHLGMAVGTHGDVCLKGHIGMAVCKDIWGSVSERTHKDGCI